MGVSFPRMLIVLFAIGMGCGDQAAPAGRPAGPLASIPTDTLVVVDSIGMELGDSVYVFGAIAGLDRGPTGEILVLDKLRRRIMVYDETGLFIEQVGRSGPGPGEMGNPAFFVVLGDGSLCVVDENGWLRFGPGWDFLDSRQAAPCRPMQMTALGQDRIIGIESRFGPDAGRLEITKSLSQWADSTPGSASIVFFTRAYVVDEPQDVYVIDLNPMLFTASGERVYLAPDPRDEPMVYVFGINGTPLDTLLLEYPQVARTEEEMAEEKLFYESYVSSTTSGFGQVDWEPAPYRSMIRSLGVDSLDRLWIQRGFELTPTFDIFDPESLEPVSVALISDREDANDWRFDISKYGIIAFPEDPELFQQVYLIK